MKICTAIESPCVFFMTSSFFCQHFFICVTKDIDLFLTPYQTDAPMMPFLVNKLNQYLRRFIKPEVLSEIKSFALLNAF